MRTFGLGRMDCADCFKTENDWCPAIIVPLCTMNCGPAVKFNPATGDLATTIQMHRIINLRDRGE